MHCLLCSCVHLWLPSVVSLGGGTEDSCCNGWALPSCPICFILSIIDFMYLIPIPGDNSVEDCLLSFVHGSTSTSWTASKMFLPTLGKQLKTSNILETYCIAEKLCTVSLNWNPCPRGNPGSRCQCWLAIKGDDSQVEGSANMHWNVDTSYHHLLNVIFWPEVSLTWVFVQKQKEAAFGPEDLSNITYSKPLDNVLIAHMKHLLVTWIYEHKSRN